MDPAISGRVGGRRRERKTGRWKIEQRGGGKVSTASVTTSFDIQLGCSVIAVLLTGTSAQSRCNIAGWIWILLACIEGENGRTRLY